MALGRTPLEIVNDGTHQLLARADHWDRIQLKEVARVQNGYAFGSEFFSKTSGIPLIRIRDIDSTSTVDRYNGKYSKDYLINKGDILIGMDGDFRAAKWKGENALLNQRVCRIIPNSRNYDEKFLFICLQPFLDAIHAETSSVTVKHISSRTIGEIPLPLPTLTEQKAIVSKIEELFSELEKGIENLRNAQQQLKTYRQAVMKWAFEGRLTNENLKDGELPEGWKCVKLETVSKISGGLIKNSKRNNLKTKLPYLRVANVHFNHLDLSQIHRIGITESEVERVKLKNNDLLFVEGNGSIEQIGRVALWNGSIENCVHQNHIIKSRLSGEIIPKFALYFFCSIRGRDKIKKQANSTSGLHTLSLGKISNLELPIASIKEQNTIIQAIESRLSVADKMEEDISQSLRQSEALKQSILKKAFGGNLT